MLLQFGSLFCAHWMRFSSIFFVYFFVLKPFFISSQIYIQFQVYAQSPTSASLSHLFLAKSDSSILLISPFRKKRVLVSLSNFVSWANDNLFASQNLPLFSIFKSAFFTIQSSFECWLRIYSYCSLCIELLWFVFLQFSSVRFVNSMPVSSVIFRLHRNVSFVPFLLSISLVAFVFSSPAGPRFECKPLEFLPFDSIHYLLIIVAIRFVYSLDLC